MLRSLNLHRRTGCIGALVAVVAVEYSQPLAAAQPRQVLCGFANRTDPVVVTRITHAGVTVQRGRFVKSAAEAPDPITSFQADNDWLEKVAVYVLNRTDKVIVYASFTFGFPETTVGQTRAMLPLTLGQIPPFLSVDLNGAPIRQPPGAKPIAFMPGQTMAIRLADYIDEIKSRVERIRPTSGRTVSGLTIITVSFGRYFFEDGMQWNAGYRLFDPESRTWQRMDRAYFPGNMDKYWPGRTHWVDQR